MDFKNYLTAKKFYWYVKEPQDQEKCYAFSEGWFTNGKLIKPELENVSYKKRTEIFSKSNFVSYEIDSFRCIDLVENTKTNLDKIISETEIFFEKVNKGEVKKSRRCSFEIDGITFIFDGELEDRIIAINYEKFLKPMINLLINLIAQCSSFIKDEIELYFNPENEVIYLAWNWDDGDRQYITWVGGIKPIEFDVPPQNIKTWLKSIEEEIQQVNKKDFYNFMVKDPT